MFLKIAVAQLLCFVYVMEQVLLLTFVAMKVSELGAESPVTFIIVILLFIVVMAAVLNPLVCKCYFEGRHQNSSLLASAKMLQHLGSIA